ncbi:MAG: PepSY-associated TM helix domain-containing protein [Rhodospirillaceae bacterium]
MTPQLHKVWLFGHRWIGLLLGLAIALIGLSGSLLVFEDSIDSALYPELHTVIPTGPVQSFDDLAAAAQAAHPNKTLLYLLRNNDQPETSISALMTPKSRQVPGRTQVFINPYTGAVLGSRPEHNWLGMVHDFHGEFLAGPTGELLVGALAIVLLFSLTGGLVLWWPKSSDGAESGKGRWKRALSVKSSGTLKRLLRDVHNVTGASFFVVLFVCSLTALPLIWPEESKVVLSKVLGEPPVEEHRRTSTRPEDLSHTDNRISLGQAAMIGQAQSPGHWVNLALNAFGPTGSYMIRTLPAGETAMSKSITVFVDRYSGEVIDTADPSQQHIVDALASDFAGTIHNGSILGLPGRWLVFAGGLAFPMLFVTGLLVWLRGKFTKDVLTDLREQPQSRTSKPTRKAKARPHQSRDPKSRMP